MGRVVAVVAVVLVVAVVSGCTPAGRPATVEGVAIEAATLEDLRPPSADLTADERAANLYLLILHRLLSESAEQEFDFLVSDEQRRTAFETRTAGLGSDVDAALAQRGVTRDRVLLEADLDVIREELERRLVHDEAPGVDFDAAYRTFLAANSRVCLSALQIADDGAVPALEDLVASGVDLAGVEEAYPDAVEPVDVECSSPALLGPGLNSVALDAEIGDVHVVRSEAGSFVATVDERDAPAPDSVRDEVLQVAVDTQGPEVFNEWAAAILRDADVEVDGSLGRWEPIEGSNGIPTVVTG